MKQDVNDNIEWAFYNFGKMANGFLTVDGQMGHNDFDALILRTLLIDGEVLIRIHKDVKNPYGLTFELIDAASLDFTRNREATPTQNGIVLGVEVDKYYKPVAYYIRHGLITTYQAGQVERVDAKDIIHIFKKEFAHQVRGIPPFNAVLDDLKQLDDFKVAELMAAKTSACLGIFYEKNQMAQQGDFQVTEDPEVKGEFIQSIEPRHRQRCTYWI